jgi:hypothetical protein
MEILEPKQIIRAHQNHRRKPLRQKSAARKVYEERFPSISLRVDSDVKTMLLIDAKRNNMTLKEYLAHLVRGANLNIESELKKSFEKGRQDGEQDGFERGKRTAVIQNRDKIIEQTRKQTGEEDAIFFDCYHCGSPIRIIRGSVHHYYAAYYLQSCKFLCPSCELRRRMAALAEHSVDPKPSWWPMYYPWPPKKPSKIPP